MKIKTLLFLITIFFAKPAFAQDALMGEVRAFAFGYVPKNWVACEGQLLAISQNQALFSLLGTTYGGNGIQTFALPDLRERMVIGLGQGSGLTNRLQGQTVGLAADVVLVTNNLPAHTHTANLKVSSAVATTATPTVASALAVSKQVVSTGDRSVLKYAATTTATPLKTMKTSATGQLTPTAISIVQPVTASQYAICVYGLFPSRN
jgi:microcystin-dependent protein